MNINGILRHLQQLTCDVTMPVILLMTELQVLIESLMIYCLQSSSKEILNFS